MKKFIRKSWVLKQIHQNLVKFGHVNIFEQRLVYDKSGIECWIDSCHMLIIKRLNPVIKNCLWHIVTHQCNKSIYSIGNNPYLLLKHFVKQEGLVNPESKVICEILQRCFFISSFAFSSLNSFINRLGERLNNSVVFLYNCDWLIAMSFAKSCAMEEAAKQTQANNMLRCFIIILLKQLIIFRRAFF